MGRRLRLYKIMFGLFKKKEIQKQQELVQGKFFVVEEQTPWGLYHIRTDGLTGYNTDICSYVSAEPANKLANIYNQLSRG